MAHERAALCLGFLTSQRKANRRNVELLRGRARVPQGNLRKAKFHDWLFVGLMIFLLIALLVGYVTIAWWVIAQVARWVFGGA